MYLNNSDYLTSYNSSKKTCVLSFLEDNTSQFWLLGAAFYRAYYVVHDLDNQKVGLAGKFIDQGEPIVYTPKSSSLSEVKEDDPYTSYIMWILVGTCSLIAIAMMGAMIYHYCIKNKKKVSPMKIHADERVARENTERGQRSSRNPQELANNFAHNSTQAQLITGASPARQGNKFFPTPSNP